MYVSRLKKNLSLFFFFLFSHTLSLCLTAKEKSSYFSLLLHTLVSSRRLQHFALSSLQAISSKAATLYSFLLNYLLESGNTLLSPSSCIPPKWKSIFFSLSFMLYFPSSCKEDSWAKDIKFVVALSIYKTLFIFHFGLKIHYLFN